MASRVNPSTSPGKPRPGQPGKHWKKLKQMHTVTSAMKQSVKRSQQLSQQKPAEEAKAVAAAEEKAQEKATSEEQGRKKSNQWGKLSILSRLVTAGNKKKTPEVVPETKRRFLFDDIAARHGSKEKLFEKEKAPEIDFNDIVDQDDARVEAFVSHELVGALVESTHFRIFIFGLIVINSILIGLQTDEKTSIEYRYLFNIFDQIVMATFLCEILLKWYYGFWIFWKTGWNILDFVIILALVLGPQVSFLSSGRILRILRVLRAFRSLRSISALAGLSMVVQTMIQSIPDMANIMLLLCIILLVFAVSGVTLFSSYLPQYFGDLQNAMFSLFICVTQDGWVTIYNEFRAKGEALHIGGSLYMFVSIILGAFVFANLVVAVVVTNLEMAMNELRSEDAEIWATEFGGGGEDEDDSLEPPEESEIVKARDTLDHFHYEKQTPVEITDLKSLSNKKLEKYFMLLTAMEENLSEYQQLRADLDLIIDVVKGLNVQYETVDVTTPSYQSTSHLGEQKSNLNIGRLRQGDIISNLMKLEEEKVITSAKMDLKAAVRSIAASDVKVTGHLGSRRDSGRRASISKKKIFQ